MLRILLIAVLSISVTSCTTRSAEKPTVAKPQETFSAYDSVVRVTKTVEYDVLDLRTEAVEQGCRGTAVVVQQAQVGAKFVTLILTAKHVLETTNQYQNVPHISMVVSFKVNNIYGEELAASPIACHNFADICLMAVDGKIGHAIATMEKDPPLGGKLYHIGAAAEFLGRNLAFTSEGLYGGHYGIEVDGEKNGEKTTEVVVNELTSVPAYQGSSGGPVFYEGQVMGIVARVRGPLTFLTGRQYVHDMARSAWQIYMAFTLQNALTEGVKE